MPDDRPEWLDDHVQIAVLAERHTALVTTVEAGFARVEKATDALSVVTEANSRAQWAAINELRQNGGWKGRTLSIGVPTGLGAALATALSMLLAGRAVSNQQQIERPPVAMVAPMGRNTARAIP